MMCAPIISRVEPGPPCGCARALELERRVGGKRHLNTELRNLPFPFPATSPLPFTSSVSALQKATVSWTCEPQTQKIATNSWVGIWKSLNKRFYFFSLTLKRRLQKSCRRSRISGRPRVPWQKILGAFLWKHGNRMNPPPSLWETQCHFPKSPSVIQKTSYPVIRDGNKCICVGLQLYSRPQGKPS